MRLFTLVWIAGLLMLAAPATAGELIDFEKFPDGTTIDNGTRITTQFACVGVSFFETTDPGGPQIRQFNLAGQSGVNALGGVGNVGGHSFQQPIRAVFDGTTSFVRVLALDVGVRGIIMKAYSCDELVDSDSVDGTGRDVGVGYVDELSVSGEGIDRVVIEQTTNTPSGDGFLIDDFEFGGLVPEDPNGGYGPNDRPVYLILSLAREFEIPELSGRCDVQDPEGSQTFIINIGTFIAGEEIPDTRFELLEILGEIDLPGNLTLEDLAGYQITILGSFDTFSPNSIHIASPDEGDVPVKVQEAFFLASPFLTDEFVEQFPTTGEIAQFIYDTATAIDFSLAEEPDPLTPQQIVGHIFLTEATIECPPGDVACEADGDLFPHPTGDFAPLFNFSLQIAPDGKVEVEVVVDIKVDIKPGSDVNPINLGAKGVLPVAILATPGLIEDIDDVDPDSINVGEIEPVKYHLEDVNDDGLDDLIFHFKIQELVAAGVLTVDTEELTIEAQLSFDGANVRGSDVVRPKAAKNKKKK